MQDGIHDTPRAVLIASLSHSGSTLLDLLLGSNSRMCSLGEVHESFRGMGSEPPNPCTCGQHVDSCVVWGHMRELWRADPGISYREFHAALIDRVHECLGPGTIPIDSSKHLLSFRALEDGGLDGVRVLFLMKDVRSLAESMGRWKFDWHERYKRNMLYNVLRWFFANRKLLRFVREANLPVMHIGYEELCFRPALLLRTACEFLGVEFQESMLTPEAAHSHMLEGNRMRFNPDKRGGITYDPRWFFSKRIVLGSWMLLPFLEWNRRHVYSNLYRYLSEAWRDRPRESAATQGLPAGAEIGDS